MTLEELTAKAERATYLIAQLAEIEKTNTSNRDKIRWFNGGGNIDEHLQAEMVLQGFLIVREKLQAELESLLGNGTNSGEAVTE